MTEEQRREIEKLAPKIPVIKELYDEYIKLTESTYYDSVITLEGQINDWNKQLKITKDGGQIDLFAPKETQDFTRALNYFKEMLFLHDTLDKLKSRLSPKEFEDLQKDKKRRKLSGIAI